MGSAIHSIGGFLGTSDGPKLSESNPYINQIAQYATDPENLKYTDASTGSQLATDAVQNNGILGQLFGQGGALSGAIGKENQLQNQGYQLTPEDQTMYGQASGDVARLFGQQENSAANNLAMRGLASAPTGAAGATFSGLAGNKNEMLAKAQQQIMQQRYQNTQQQIQQQQQFISQLGGQAQNAIQGQYNRQLQGSNAHMNGLQAASNAKTAEADWNNSNQPLNFADYGNIGLGQVGSGYISKGIFGGGGSMPTSKGAGGAGAGMVGGQGAAWGGADAASSGSLFGAMA
jgi:hypothetical protein